MGLTVNVHGGTASMCTDIGTSPVGATCHLPLNKIVWGDDSVSYKANETYPLPVQIMAVTGESLVVSGNLGPSGDFPIFNKFNGNTAQHLVVAGSTDGTTPVGVTGHITVQNFPTLNNQGLTLNTRELSSTTDSITVSGNVGITGGLGALASTDSISVFGYDGGRYVNTTLFGGNGTTIGNSGDALNVNMVNAGVTFTLNVAATIGVTNPNSGLHPVDALAIQGTSGGGGNPVVVQGRNGEAIEVVNAPSSAVGVTGTFFSDGTQKTTVSEIVRPSAIVSGYTLAAVTHTILPSNALKTGVTIKAGKSNTDFIYVGNSGLSGGVTMNGYPLQSGESVFLECNNSNLVFLTGTTGDVRGVHFIGS